MGPEVSVMVMSLNSHVVDCGLNLGPGGLNSRWAHVRAQDPERRMKEKGLQRGHPPWRVISCFLSLSVYLASGRTL